MSVGFAIPANIPSIYRERLREGLCFNWHSVQLAPELYRQTCSCLLSCLSSGPFGFLQLVSECLTIAGLESRFLKLCMRSPRKPDLCPAASIEGAPALYGMVPKFTRHKGGSGAVFRWQGPLVLLVLGCLVCSLAFWDGADLMKRLKSMRWSSLVQAWTQGADHNQLGTEMADDGLLGIPFIKSMPEEPSPDSHVTKEEVELGISQLAVARVDCWNPCHSKAGPCILHCIVADRERSRFHLLHVQGGLVPLVRPWPCVLPAGC